MSEEYIRLPNDYGSILAGQLLEKIEKAEVTTEKEVVIVLVGCPTSHQIGAVSIPPPKPSNYETEKIEADYTDKMVKHHMVECTNKDLEHNVCVIIRRINPERKQNAPSEASSLAILFNKMLYGPSGENK